jgi:hypothetical protein
MILISFVFIAILRSRTKEEYQLSIYQWILLESVVVSGEVHELSRIQVPDMELKTSRIWLWRLHSGPILRQ